MKRSHIIFFIIYTLFVITMFTLAVIYNNIGFIGCLLPITIFSALIGAAVEESK